MPAGGRPWDTQSETASRRARSRRRPPGATSRSVPPPRSTRAPRAAPRRRNRAARVDTALLSVQREREEAATLIDPERLVEACPQLVGFYLEPLRQRLVAPH